MQGFKDWFVLKHGFWPALPKEKAVDVFSRLCDSVAEYVSEAVKEAAAGHAPAAEDNQATASPETREYKGLFPISPDYEWHSVKIAAMGRRPRGGFIGICDAIRYAVTGKEPPFLPVEIEFSGYVRADRPILIQINSAFAKGTISKEAVALLHLAQIYGRIRPLGPDHD